MEIATSLRKTSLAMQTTTATPSVVGSGVPRYPSDESTGLKYVRGEQYIDRYTYNFTETEKYQEI